jgi:hypothetical protein
VSAKIFQTRQDKGRVALSAGLARSRIGIERSARGGAGTPRKKTPILFLIVRNHDMANEFRITESEVAGMAEAGDIVHAEAAGEIRPTRAENASRAVRMLERLTAGSTLTEVAQGEDLTPRRARELVAEIVAERGYDP